MAQKGLSKQTKKIIRNIVEQRTNELAQEASMRIFAEYIDIISEFYDDYDPDYYKRTGGLFESHSQPYTVSEQENGHTLVSGGITITDDNMPEAYHDTSEYVLFNSFLEGWHGGCGIEATKIPRDELEAVLSKLKKEFSRRKINIDV